VVTAELSLSTATLGVVLGNLAIALAMTGLLVFRRDTNALKWWAGAFALDAFHFAVPFFGPTLGPQLVSTLAGTLLVGSASAMLAGVLVATERQIGRRALAAAVLTIGAAMAAPPAFGASAATGDAIVSLIVVGLLVTAGCLLLPAAGPAARGPMRLAAASLVLMGLSRAGHAFFGHMTFFGLAELMVTLALNMFAGFALVMLVQRRELLDLRVARDRLAESERKLSVSEERFRDIAEAASDWIWEMDSDLRFSYLSDRVATLTGIKPAEVIGLTRRELSDDDGSDWQKHYADLDARRPFRNFQYSTRNFGKGTRHFRISGRPVVDNNGAFAGYRGTGTDVTAEVEAEAAAKGAHALLIEAIESIEEGFALYDREGRLVECNSRYKTFFFRGHEDFVQPGMAFAEIIRTCVSLGMNLTGSQDPEAWLAERLARLKSPGEPFEQLLRDGRVVLTREYKTRDGGTVSVHTDITGERLAQTRLADAIENIPTGFLLCDAEDRIVTYNQRFWDWLPPDSQATMAEGYTYENFMRSVLQSDQILDAQVDNERWLERRLAAHRNPGKPIIVRWTDGRTMQISESKTRDGGIVSVYADITDLKDREAALEEAQATLQLVLDNVDEGIAMVDADLRIAVFNDQGLDLLGAPKDRFGPGATIEALMRWLAERGEFGPGDIDEQVRDRVERMRGNAPSTVVRERPDGRILEIRRKPLPDQGGFVSTYFDITERKRAEQALRTSEERYALAMEGASEGLWDRDIAGGNVYLSRRLKQMVGIDDGEFTRSIAAWTERVHPDDRQHYRDKVVAHLKGESDHYECEFRMKCGDGAYHWMFDRGLALRDETGWAYRMAGSVADITERKQAEQALKEAKDAAVAANRTKSQFLANMSHELRTPLNAIIGFSEMMHNELFGPIGNAHYGEYARDIFESGSHLLNLINDILDVSKLEAGKIELLDSNCDIRTIAGSAMRTVAERAESGGVTIEIEAGGNLPALRADERRLKQILLNLLSNAVKFTPEDGRIVIAAEAPPAGGFVVEIRDTGIGMSAEEIPQALAPFIQIDSELARKFDGTGLGLPLTKSLVELHGGTMEIESEPGEGTVVRLRFPDERVVALRAAG
jgi:PAS domain S-box-containing protein